MTSDVWLKAPDPQLKSLQENLYLHLNRPMESKFLVLVALKKSLKLHAAQNWVGEFDSNIK